MGPAFWISETYLLAFSGSTGAKMIFRWTGIQAWLWPVTFVVRVIARDPLRDPKPVRPDYTKIHALECELGMVDTITFHELIGLKKQSEQSDNPESPHS